MPEIGTSGSMSGDGKRGVGHRPQATAPILDSTIASVRCDAAIRPLSRVDRTHQGHRGNDVNDPKRASGTAVVFRRAS
jgi:hypothetical protein